jgi:hypothetical protein
VPHYPYDTLIDYADRFFEIADTVDIFNVGGGEPLLNDCLPDFLSYAGNKYRDRILQRFEVVTNGTLLPNDKLIDVMIKNNIFVLLDDYGKDRSYRAGEAAALLDKNGISYKLRSNNSGTAYCDGWVDLSSFSDNPKNAEDTKWLFEHCVQANELRCHPVIDGKIYVCSTYRRVKSLGLIDDNNEEYFDLLDDSIPLDEKKDKFARFLNLQTMSSCAFCNGWLPDSKRYVPAQEQL